MIWEEINQPAFYGNTYNVYLTTHQPTTSDDNSLSL